MFYTKTTQTKMKVKRDFVDQPKKLYQYHSHELQFRLFYLFFSFMLIFFTFFFNIDFIFYKLSFSELTETVTTSFDTAPQNPFGVQQLFNSLNNTGFIFTEVFEVFFSYLLLSGYLTFLVSLPLFFYHLYKFLLPGLCYSESFLLKFFFCISLGLSLLAHLLAYKIILPYALSFFLNFQISVADLQEPSSLSTEFSLLQTSSINNYLDPFSHKGILSSAPPITFLGRIYPWTTFLINLFTITNFLFQLPLLLFMSFILFTKLLKSGKLTKTTYPELRSGYAEHKFEQKSASHGYAEPIVENQFLNTKLLRKLLFFLLVLLTAIFSPPDIYSQLFLLLPLFIIVETFILTLYIYNEYNLLVKKKVS